MYMAQMEVLDYTICLLTKMSRLIRLQEIHLINKHKEVYNVVVDHLSRLLFEEKEELILINDEPNLGIL